MFETVEAMRHGVVLYQPSTINTFFPFFQVSAITPSLQRMQAFNLQPVGSQRGTFPYQKGRVVTVV